MQETSEQSQAFEDRRMSFDEAVEHIRRGGAAAFAETPVFEEDQESAAGARIFLLAPDGKDGYLMYFIAGPFFSAAYAANENVPAAEIPERVKELRYALELLERPAVAGAGPLRRAAAHLAEGLGTEGGRRLVELHIEDLLRLLLKSRDVVGPVVRRAEPEH